MNIRMTDAQAVWEEWSTRAAEVRCACAIRTGT